MKHILIILTATLGTTIFVVSCAKDKVPYVEPTPAVCTDTIQYSTEIVAIISQNCSTSGCHDQSASAGYSFLTHADISANADIMLKSMQYAPGTNPMPQGADQLSDSIVQKFECWISQGKLNN